MSDVVDIRLKVSFKDHRKRKKLAVRLGAGGVVALLDLWLSAAESHPDGRLAGYTAEDVEIDAGWAGPPGAFTAAAVECGWLDVTECGYCLHDWAEHQAYIIHAPERQAIAKHAAGVRWASRVNALSMLPACPENAHSAKQQCPLPSPDPSPDPPTPQGGGAAGMLAACPGSRIGGLADGYRELADRKTVVAWFRRVAHADPSAPQLACWKAAIVDLQTRNADPAAIAKGLRWFESAEPKYRGTIPEARRLTADWLVGLATKAGEAGVRDVLEDA